MLIAYTGATLLPTQSEILLEELQDTLLNPFNSPASLSLSLDSPLTVISPDPSPSESLSETIVDASKDARLLGTETSSHFSESCLGNTISILNLYEIHGASTPSASIPQLHLNAADSVDAQLHGGGVLSTSLFPSTDSIIQTLPSTSFLDATLGPSPAFLPTTSTDTFLMPTSTLNPPFHHPIATPQPFVSPETSSAPKISSNAPPTLPLSPFTPDLLANRDTTDALTSLNCVLLSARHLDNLVPSAPIEVSPTPAPQTQHTLN